MMPPSQQTIGTVVVIDRATRATADVLELFLAPALVAEWLGRAPDVVANGILSWGRVTAEQIHQLLDLCGDGDGQQLWGESRARHAGRDAFISLVYRTEA